MVLLVHHPVSAASRKIRLMMAEKKILFVLREEEPWNLSPELYKLNAAGELPVVIVLVPASETLGRTETERWPT